MIETAGADDVFAANLKHGPRWLESLMTTARRRYETRPVAAPAVRFLHGGNAAKFAIGLSTQSLAVSVGAILISDEKSNQATGNGVRQTCSVWAHCAS